jgi:UDP-N-acetylmuramyl pentapeptide phosphotransferase/UDP-N-acetylglucosamine-1-phosphate transferase
VRARLTVRNHAGRPVPATLGLALAAGGAIGAAAVALTDHVGTPGWIVSAGAGLVVAAGLVDDLSDGAGPRGLRGHLRALAAGHLSTGIVKLFTVSAVSVVTVAVSAEGRSVPARLTGVVLIAAATNLWNDLDVRPGRAIKFGLPALPAVVACEWSVVPFAPGVALAALLALPWDLGERAMLGDAGANLLGFTIGVALFGALTDAQVVVAAAAAVGLNLLAETLTLSRAIDAVAPLRWFDRLGMRA